MRCAIVIERAADDHSAYARDLPGCGATVDEVEREMAEAIQFHLDRMREDWMLPPEPTSVVDHINV